MTTAERHEAICHEFLEHAEDEYRRGDYLQAAEKAWGAFAHCMNCIAKEKAWGTGTHRQLRDNARRLIDSDPDHAERRRLLFAAVESLHANFHQECLGADDLRDGIDNARELIEVVRSLAGR